MGQHLFKQIQPCSIIGCEHTTTATRWTDPRKRWMLGVHLKDEDRELNINLCPVHVREIFELQERDFVELEKAELLAASVSAESRPV